MRFSLHKMDHVGTQMVLVSEAGLVVALLIIFTLEVGMVKNYSHLEMNMIDIIRKYV